MTSNIGSQRILDTEPDVFDSEPGREQIKATLLDELRKFFRPELLNRIDEVVVFRPLSREVLKKVLRIQLKNLAKLLAARGLALEVTEAAETQLVELGYEPAFGARPLRRVVARELQDPLADKLLGTTHPSGARVLVDVDAEKRIVFNVST